MNWLDIAIAAVILLFTLFGLRSGLIKELFSMVAIAAGMAAGIILYDVAGDAFIKWGLVGNKPIASVGGFMSVMFVVYVVVQLAGWALSGIVGSLNLNWLNRLLGGAFGAIKGVIVAFLIASAVGFFYSDKEPPLSTSALIPYLNRSYALVKAAVPDDFQEKIQRARKLIQDKGFGAARREAEKIKDLIKNDGESSGKK